MNTLTLEYIKSILPPRPDNSHKMTFGHVLNIAGSLHYRGAAYLSSLSALRVGAGYVTLASSPSVCDSVSALTPNIVTFALRTLSPLSVHSLQRTANLHLKDAQIVDVQTLSPQAVLQLRDKLTQASAISIGSGLSIGQSTDQCIDITAINTELTVDVDVTLCTEMSAKISTDLNSDLNSDLRSELPICNVIKDNQPHSNELIPPQGNHGFFYALLNEIQTCTKPVIFDADALNFISHLLNPPVQFGTTTVTLPNKSIITPHPKELARLLNMDVATLQTQRMHFARLAAKQLNTIVVLKGKNTVITDGNDVFINPTGNSALAKAGTGDVLTGMISGFCAQGVSPINAACLGVYLHGLAGNIAAEDLSQYGMLASDLLSYIPKAILKVLAI